MFLALVAVFLVGCEVGEESYYYNSSTGTETGTEAGAGGDDTNTGSYGDDTDCLAEFPTFEKAFPGFKDVFQGASHSIATKTITYAQVTNGDEYINNLPSSSFNFVQTAASKYERWAILSNYGYLYFYDNTINYAITTINDSNPSLGKQVGMTASDLGTYYSGSSSYIEDNVFDAIFPEVKGCKYEASFSGTVRGDYKTQLNEYITNQGFTKEREGFFSYENINFRYSFSFSGSSTTTFRYVIFRLPK
jgi:hypothetical protein